MRAARVLMGVVATVWLALVAPNVVLARVPSLWVWLATADSGSDLAVLGAARSADPDQVDVVVLGSSMAGANVSSWMLERDSGRTVVNLGVNGISAIGSAMWVDEVCRLRPKTVVWMTGPVALQDRRLRKESGFDWSMAWAAWGPGMLTRSDVWGAAVADMSLIVRLRQVPRLAWDGQLANDPIHLSNRPRLRPRRFAAVARRRAAEVGSHRATADGAGARAMTAAIAQLHDLGTEVVLVPAPVHPTVTGAGNYWPSHVDALEQISQQTGARFVPPDQHPEWVDADFRDPIHLDHPGQRKLTRLLVEEGLMLFNSIPFAVLAVPTVLAALALRGAHRRALLLIASWVFYAGGEPSWLILLWISTGLDFGVGRMLARTDDVRRRKLLLTASLVGNLGILFAYKYAPFLLSLVGVGSFQPAAYEGGFHFLGGVPAGLSFYTFQSLSYTIDVYRRRQEAIENPLDFALYVAFFPQLIAGPVVRAGDFFPQLYAERRIDADRMWRAVELFGVGLFKKTVIADNLGLLGDPIWRDPGAHSGLTLVFGALVFWGQVYADFSAYSTMARGLGKAMGFDLPRNFDYPLLADGPLSYRRSWHMTMSAWFRDYVFHPLGGTRVGPWRAAVNIGIVWTLFGVWHGAGLTFLVWGLYNGVIQALTREFYRRGYRVPSYPGKRVAGTVLNLALMLPSAIVFRSAGLAEAGAAYGRVATLAPGDGVPSLTVLIVSAMAVAHLVSYRWYNEDVLVRIPVPARAALLVGLTWAVVVLGATGRPFVYFQF